MKYLSFKRIDSKWYVDLPDWKGLQQDLEMVCGADTMLSCLDYRDTGKISLLLSLEEPKEMKMELIQICGPVTGGAYYYVDSRSFKGEIWLCDVTLSVFGEFPKLIYFHPINY